ncbi:MAG: STAS domain-containing protein [Caldilineaceae bacterium]
MKIESSQTGPVVVVTLNGRFDAHEVPEVRKSLDNALEQGQGKVVINLSQVSFIDSSGLSMLIQGMKRCRERIGDLYLTDLQQPVRIIFELTRLDKVFAIFPSQAEALRALGAI